LSVSTPCREREAALEGADVAFTEIIVPFLFLLLFPLFSLDRQGTFRELHLEVLLVHPRKISSDLIGIAVSTMSTAGAPPRLFEEFDRDAGGVKIGP
jgi:hypothetical protein